MFDSKSDKDVKLMRLCPDMEQMAEFLKIKNGYTNSEDRASFSLNIFKCQGTSCKNETEIRDLLQGLMFNIYMIE